VGPVSTAHYSAKGQRPVDDRGHSVSPVSEMATSPLRLVCLRVMVVVWRRGLKCQQVSTLFQRALQGLNPYCLSVKGCRE
jgi:hypothetical protein